MCGQHRPWLPFPLARGHTLQCWPLPEGCILPVVAREMSCPPGLGPLLEPLGPTHARGPQHLQSTSLSQTGSIQPLGPSPKPHSLWTLASGRTEWKKPSQSLELASVSSVTLPLELLPESQGQCPVPEKGTGEHFHLMLRASPQEGIFPGHELASVLVGSRPCISDLKVTLANAGARDASCP